MSDNDFKAKKLVFDKYIKVNDSYFDFSSELKLLIDIKSIYVEDALNIILELMYGVINYNYDENDVDNEFKKLTEKVVEYNFNDETTVKNSILFFKDYSCEIDLFEMFCSGLKINSIYEEEFEQIISYYASRYSEDSLEKHDEKQQGDKSPSFDSKETSESDRIRANIELDNEIRKLGYELRKQNLSNWKEILKASDVYKQRHGIKDDGDGSGQDKPLQKEVNDVKDQSNTKDDIDKSNSKSNEVESSKKLSEREIRKLEVRSSYLSNKIKYSIKHCSELIRDIKEEMEGENKDFLDDDLILAIPKLEENKRSLLYYQEQCGNFEILDTISETITDSDNYLNVIKEQFSSNLQKIRTFKVEMILEKTKEYNDLKSKMELVFDDKLNKSIELSSKLNKLIENSNKFYAHVNKEDFLKVLERIMRRLNSKTARLNAIKQKLDKTHSEHFFSISQVNIELDMLSSLNEELIEIDLEQIESDVIEQEKVYEHLASLNDKQKSQNVEKLLKGFEKCFSRPMFMRQLKKYNLEDYELSIIKNDIMADVLTQKIVDDNPNYKDIIKSRCDEFRKNNSEFDENEIDDLLDNISFPEVDESIIRECKNNVKMDFKDGNITVNQIELKFKNYVNKKVNETSQLQELEIIKSDPNVPSIKVHLTEDEANEIYEIAENEIYGEYGIRGNVEDRVYYLINQKIRENQSEARGRFNIVKREVFNSIQLNKKQKNEFIHQIEYYINTNDIKYYDISAEYVIKLSNEFIDYGKIRLG